MIDVTIGDLPKADSINDEDLIEVESQQGSMKVTVAQIKEEARAAGEKTLRAEEDIQPLPTVEERANKIMGFDDQGNPIAVEDNDSGVSEEVVDQKIGQGVSQGVNSHNNDAEAHPELREFITSEADRAEAAVELVDQKVADGITDGVSSVTAHATAEANRAEAASGAAFINADVYPSVGGALADGDLPDGAQFQVVDGLEIVRYRKDSSSATTEVARFPSALRVSEMGGRLASVEVATEPLPPNYIKNFLPNGNIAIAPPAWNYTGGGVLSSVSSIPEFAQLGIERAYSIPESGLVASQARWQGTNLANLGIQNDEHLLVVCLLRIEGSSFPASTSGSSMSIDSVSTPMDSSGFQQITPTLRCYWWRKKMPSVGSITQLVVGFTSSAGNFPNAPGAIRHHSGFFINRSKTEHPIPTAETLWRYMAWDGQDGSQAFFDTLASVVSDYDEGRMGGPGTPVLVLSGEGDVESWIEATLDGKRVMRSFVPWPNVSLTQRSVFNFRRDIIGGVTLRSATDDVAPYRAFGTTIGANHGYLMHLLSATGHGKSASDVGAVYAHNDVEWVILGIADENTLYMARRYTNESAAGMPGLYEHVQGGSNTADISVSSSSAATQFYPPFNNRTCRCFVDGMEVLERTGKMPYRRTAAFLETYDILERQTIIDWFIATGGVGGIPQGEPAITVSISYVWDQQGGCTIYTDFLARIDGIPLSDIMFIQAGRITPGVDGTPEYYIPKTLPVTHAGRIYDYASIDDIDTSDWANRLHFSQLDCEPEGILADRIVMLSDQYAFAIGYLPVQDTSVEKRRINIGSAESNKALQVSNSNAKVYLYAIETGNRTINEGDYFSTICYRNLSVRSSERTDSYVVRTNAETYVYADWHTSGIKRIELPPDIVGLPITIIEKSENVSLLSMENTGSIIARVDSTKSYGYLIFKTCSLQ